MERSALWVLTYVGPVSWPFDYISSCLWPAYLRDATFIPAAASGQANVRVRVRACVLCDAGFLLVTAECLPRQAFHTRHNMKVCV